MYCIVTTTQGHSITCFTMARLASITIECEAREVEYTLSFHTSNQPINGDT